MTDQTPDPENDQKLAGHIQQLGIAQQITLGKRKKG